MASSSFEIVIAADSSAVVEAVTIGEHRSHWHPDLGDDDRDPIGYGPPPRDADEPEPEDDDGVEDMALEHAIRWEAELPDHRLRIIIAPMGYATSLTFTVTVPGVLGTMKVGKLLRQHEAHAKRLRLLVENGELDGYVFRNPDDPPSYHGDSSED